MAAVHAGWRGTALRVLDAALDALEARGVRSEDLTAAFGPSISGAHYEVGEEVVAALRAAYGDPPEGAVSPGRDGHAYVDVALFNEFALSRRGVLSARVLRPPACTFSAPDLPSWRRDGPSAGRILTGIVLLAS
jgi:copper oxidase (laccase) domain-containing protein